MTFQSISCSFFLKLVCLVSGKLYGSYLSVVECLYCQRVPTIMIGFVINSIDFFQHKLGNAIMWMLTFILTTSTLWSTTCNCDSIDRGTNIIPYLDNTPSLTCQNNADKSLPQYTGSSVFYPHGMLPALRNRVTARSPEQVLRKVVAVELVALFYTNWISRLLFLIEMITQSVME